MELIKEYYAEKKRLEVLFDEMAKVIKLNVIVSHKNSTDDITNEKFFRKFIDFVESNNWIVGGHIEEIDDSEEEDINSNK